MVDRSFIGSLGPCQQHQHKEWNKHELFSYRTSVTSACWVTAAAVRLLWQESLLFMTGAIDRMGRVADGNTVCDYDPEEVKRQISLSTAVAPIDYKGCRINVLDTPGAFVLFRRSDGGPPGRRRRHHCGLRPRTVCPWALRRRGSIAKSGILPRFIYISKIDEDHKRL